MNSRSKKNAILLAAMLSATAIPMSPASAANNLMELLFGNRRVESRPVDQTHQVHPGRLQDANVRRPTVPIKRVVVTAPTNYDYKPEGLVQIDFSKVDPQITASADHGTDISPSMAMDEFGLKIDHLKAAHVLAEKEISDAIVSYYATKQRPIWTASYDVTRQAKAVVALFAKAADDGLDPQDYAVTVPSDDYDRANIPARLKELADFELSMSARALRYAMDQGEGRINPNRLSGFHDFAMGRIKPREVIEQLASSNDPAATLAAFEPQNKWYTELKENLRELGDTNEPTVSIAPGTMIRPGDTSAELRNVVALIRAKAPQDYLATHKIVLAAHENSYVYDESLVEAIKDFQKAQGRKADGIIGSSTIKSLQTETILSKRNRILYSMERLRWLPHDFGKRYVFINQPAYRAQYFNDNTEKLAMNIVVGSPTNQTYFFDDTIETVVFNPSWGVPRSIILNEMMPKILSNPSYLENSGYEVYDKTGRVVPSSSINWYQVASNGGGVGIRQKPSLDNALGELKILFPNSHDIYMHDTPAKSYFKRDMRALSHGCIRLERPRDMAAAVLGVPVEDLKQYFGKNERSVKVKDQLPVYVSYFTAWPDATTGEIRYYDDIYERDAYLEKAFVKTRAMRQATSVQTAKL
ncbi:murein L,D-transpeptidase [Phyllobacterium zundukense]|jgi:murein L,D-transpeptidase YcbB/YkuD|uniref:L,D-transpeptidase family protein n=1 Tax=Phyllobacterium zundukense TaxID=1867719 RepID=A0ACD4D1U6_9HYPH|nr:L,D-transpeptidase family protein [Phyllobacterium zundukense]UXN59810.1 L,D-transpeptidase family protein [Phyllobacterium zundukense]